MLKRIPNSIRSLIIFICIFSVLTVTVPTLMNGSSASAAESNAVNGTASAIQDAIDDLGRAPGTIYIKAGEFDLGGIVTLHEGVKIIGAGVGSTVIHTYGDNQWFLIPGGADDCGISGITMIHVPYKAGNGIVVGARTGYDATVHDFVIDNMEFYNYGATEASIFIRGTARGLICDSYFYGCSQSEFGGFGYGVAYYGNNEYTTDNSAYLGTAENVFVERCVFEHCRHSISSDSGSHYVFRYNTVKGGIFGYGVDAHGGYYTPTGSGYPFTGQEGSSSAEIYNNKIIDPEPSGSDYGIGLRGGQSYIFNNYISGYEVGVRYRLELSPLEKALVYKVHDSYEWGNTIEDFTFGKYSIEDDSESYIRMGKEVFLNTKPAGYTPYTYPHPLTPEEGAPTNGTPKAKNDSYITNQQMELVIDNPGVLINDSDPEGDTLSAVLVSSVSNGSLKLNTDGSFTYTPVPGFRGIDSFRYKVSDGVNTSNTSTVTINVFADVIDFGLSSDDLRFDQQGNSLQAMRFQNNASEGTLDSLSILFDDNTPNGKVRLGVYADNSGVPGALLLDAGETAVQDGWVTITGLNLPVKQGAYYWLSYNLQETNVVTYQPDQPADSHYWVNNYAYGAMPGEFPSGGLSNNAQYVLRVTVTNNPQVVKVRPMMNISDFLIYFLAQTIQSVEITHDVEVIW